MKLISVKEIICYDVRESVYNDNILNNDSFELVHKFWDYLRNNTPFFHATFNGFIEQEINET